jgi:predicted enzyme involved in methoxymalonyl-ACP biosynthesis
MKTFAQLKKNLKKDFSDLQPIRIAILGDTATQFLSQAIRSIGFDSGFDLQQWEADFNQIERQIFDPASELYAFDPAIIIIYQASHKLLGKYNKTDPADHAGLADRQLKWIDALYTAVISTARCLA